MGVQVFSIVLLLQVAGQTVLAKPASTENSTIQPSTQKTSTPVKVSNMWEETFRIGLTWDGKELDHFTEVKIFLLF